MSESVRRRRWPYIVGLVVAALVIVALLFQWDWLIPLVDSRASAALGRPVTIGHLHVKLGRTTRVVADDVTIGNPADWPGNAPFATAAHLTADVEVMPLLKKRDVVLPLIQFDTPVIDAEQLADKKANWNFGGESSSSGGGGGPTLGRLVINNGSVHVRSAPLNTDMQISVETKAGDQSSKDQIVAHAKGTYAKQPIVADFVGGALLSLRDAGDPYPVDLRLENGPTKASVKGTIEDPLKFSGADVQLTLAGPNMALLLPLTGIAIPETPAYRIAGKLDYVAGLVKFEGLDGKVGSSDLEGALSVNTKTTRPVLTADLRSKRVDLTDLGGFIGANPGDADKGTKKPARSDGRVLPDDPISMPKLNVADVHLQYEANRIEGRHQPLDHMRVRMDIVNGDVSLHPLSFGIGKGEIESNIRLAERHDALAMKADVNFKQVDVSKLLNATGVAQGAGSISGEAVIEGTGKSLAAILGDGNGEIKLYMGSGGNLSALLVDLSGLQFGNALLSALGIPTRERIECLITDVSLKGGHAESRLTMLDTNDSRIGITGGVNLKTEQMNLSLRTKAKHFSVGTLPAPIGIGGTLGNPSIRPDLAEGGARAAAAVGLGVLLTPLAGLLPTIQFGTGDDNACAGLLREIKTPPRPSGHVRQGRH
ncbi:MAG: AsmA family protein [Acetobacteraceae bacterium]|nr:AsmA family protein [Acetobacteraceae bacterium]